MPGALRAIGSNPFLMTGIVMGTGMGGLAGGNEGMFYGGLLGGAAGLGITGLATLQMPNMSTFDPRSAAIRARKGWDATKSGALRAGGRLFGMGIAGAIGNAIGGPALGLAGAGAVMFPGAAKRTAIWGFENAAGAIGIGSRAALGTAKGMTGRFGRGVTGAVIGGMLGGLPGLGAGAVMGTMGRFNLSPAKGALKFMGRHPNLAAAGIGAVLAMPTIARGIMGAAAPDPVMMDIGMGSNAVVMGLDSNNAETLGLTLALHYRR